MVVHDDQVRFLTFCSFERGVCAPECTDFTTLGDEGLLDKPLHGWATVDEE
jgi:hypothetical protein